MTLYAQQTNYTLTSTPYDVLINAKKPPIYVNISNNSIVGQATGPSVTVLPSGTLPGFLLGYGQTQSFNVGNPPWVRVEGSGANVNFIVADEPMAMVTTPVPSVKTIGNQTLYEIENDPTVNTESSGPDMLNTGSTTIPKGALVTWSMYISGTPSTSVLTIQGATTLDYYATCPGGSAQNGQWDMPVAEKLNVVAFIGASQVAGYSWQATSP